MWGQTCIDTLLLVLPYQLERDIRGDILYTLDNFAAKIVVLCQRLCLLTTQITGLLFHEWKELRLR